MPQAPCCLLFLATLLFPCCSDVTTETYRWQEVSVAEMDGEQARMFDRAKEAAGTLGRTMVAELTQHMAEGGPVASIEYCRVRAPEVHAEVLPDLEGIQGLGRTSHKLRNPNNEPPQWARPVVEAADGQPHAFAAPEGALHVLLPIPIQSTCLVCHGDPATMPEELKSELQLHYPEDQATGFQAGDLRG